MNFMTVDAVSDKAAHISTVYVNDFRDLVHRLALVVSFLLKDTIRILNKHPSGSVDQ